MTSTHDDFFSLCEEFCFGLVVYQPGVVLHIPLLGFDVHLVKKGAGMATDHRRKKALFVLYISISREMVCEEFWTVILRGVCRGKGQYGSSSVKYLYLTLVSMPSVGPTMQFFFFPLQTLHIDDILDMGLIGLKLRYIHRVPG